MAELKKNLRVYIKNLNTGKVELAVDTDMAICLVGNTGAQVVNTFFGVTDKLSDIVNMISVLDGVRERLLDAAAELGYGQLRDELAEDDEEDDSDD